MLMRQTAEKGRKEIKNKYCSLKRSLNSYVREVVEQSPWFHLESTCKLVDDTLPSSSKVKHESKPEFANWN